MLMHVFVSCQKVKQLDTMDNVWTINNEAMPNCLLINDFHRHLVHKAGTNGSPNQSCQQVNQYPWSPRKLKKCGKGKP